MVGAPSASPYFRNGALRENTGQGSGSSQAVPEGPIEIQDVQGAVHLRSEPNGVAFSAVAVEHRGSAVRPAERRRFRARTSPRAGTAFQPYSDLPVSPGGWRACAGS